MRIRPRGPIRSHRAIERKLVAPWIIVTLSTVMVLTMLGTGFYFLVREPCTGTVTATVVAPGSTATVLETVARRWAEDQPVVRGRCAAVNVEQRDSSAVVEALGQRWNSKTAGTPPDAWVPESTVWLRRAATNAVVARMIPDRQDSLARTVPVIAMPKPAAQALGWPRTDLTWTTLVTRLAADGWASKGKSEWGPVRIGIADPTRSTAGMLALLGMSDPDDQGQPSEAGLAAVTRLRDVRAVLAPTTGEILATLTKASKGGITGVLEYLSAFSALETDVIDYNLGNPAVPLVAVYPTNGGVDADNPGVVLRAEWSDPQRQEVATRFLAFARGKAGREAFEESGFRGPRRTGGNGVTQDNGLLPDPGTPVRVAPTPEVVARVLTAWTG